MLSDFIHQKVIFQGSKLERDYRFVFEFPHMEYFIPTPDGEWLNALYFPTHKREKGHIIYFHGNAGNLQRWGRYAIDLTSLGYHVLMIDYRGFGKSTGVPNEKTLYHDAELVLQWSKENLFFVDSYIYGRSLGTAVAANLAGKYQLPKLILETPFDHLQGIIWPIAKPLLKVIPIQYSFPTKDFLASYSGKTIIFHGTRDIITPLKSAMMLKSFLNEDDEFVIIPGGTHWNLRHFRLYHEKLEEVL